jgi:dienelactone hydrolase
MTTIALFHSVLGVRPGIHDAADRLRTAGHRVHVIDQYDGRVFDDYAEAGAYVEQVGFLALMAAALDAVADLPDGFVAGGFSNGAGMAEYVALQGRCAGLLMSSGALPLPMLGADAWPRVPVQLHAAEADPLRHQEWNDDFLAAARASGASVEVFDYPVSGHLFMDASLPGEYDAPAAELLWTRALAFCAAVGAQSSAR